MSIAQFVSRGKRSFSNIFKFLDSMQKYKNSYVGKFEKKSSGPNYYSKLFLRFSFE